jgi:two-component sensor histidine kinase
MEDLMSLWIRPGPGEVGSTELAPSFELYFRPCVDLISLVRCFVADFYTKAVPDPDAAQRLALTTHELLENAAKYSADGEAAILVELQPGTGAVSVRTANRATGAQIAALQSAFAEISTAPSASAYYAEAMRRTAVKRSGSGGLGLARIWAESDMQLELLVEGDRVEVHARGHVAEVRTSQQMRAL